MHNLHFSKIKKAFNLLIFKRISLETITSKVWIIFTALIFLTSIILEILFAFMLIPIKLGDRLYISFLPILLMIIWITFFHIFNISGAFIREINNGMINLEINNGISKSRLYWERILVNKTFTMSFVLIYIFIYFFFFIVSPFPSSKLIALNYTPGLFFILIYDLFLMMILLLIVMIKKNVLVGVFGTLIFVIFAAIPIGGPFFTGFSKIPGNFAANNYKLGVAKQVNDLSQKYKENSYIEQMLKDMTIFSNNKLRFFDIGGNEIPLLEQNKKVKQIFVFSTPEYDKDLTSGHSEYYSMLDLNLDYLFDLMLSGLGSEIEKLPLFIRKDEEKELKKYFVKISDETKQTFTWKAMEKIKELADFKNESEQQKAYSDEQIRKSIFYTNDKFVNDYFPVKDRLSGEFEYLNVLKKVEKGVGEQSKELLKLTKEIILGNYLFSNGEAIESDSSQERTNKFQFVENELGNSTPQHDWSWSRSLNITPGARTINAIMFKLLGITSHINSASYPVSHNKPNVQSINDNNPEKVLSAIKIQLANPLNVFWKQITNISKNEILNSSLDNAPFYSNILFKLPTNVYKVEQHDPTQPEKGGFEKFKGKFKSGRNYQTISLVGSSINVPLTYIVMLLIECIVILLSYLIFYKKIIK